MDQYALNQANVAQNYANTADADRRHVALRMILDLRRNSAADVEQIVKEAAVLEKYLRGDK